MSNISIHAPREGGDASPKAPIKTTAISIHAPREGGDVCQQRLQNCRLISIHAPREGGDCISTAQYHKEAKFQSTPPARGATFRFCGRMTEIFISIHAPREGGDDRSAQITVGMVISIHAPREGGDVVHAVFLTEPREFQSTPPARGATALAASRGGYQSLFQSTPPARGATTGIPDTAPV